MSKNYSTIYRNENITSKRLRFSAAMVMFNPCVVISALNAPKNNPILLSSFSDEQLTELENYLRGYTDKPYVIEAEKQIYIAISSIYPTATACLLLRMDMKPGEILRLLKERSELFVFSPNIESPVARMSKRLDAERKDFLELFADIERVFTCLDRFNLSFNDDEVIDGYYEQVINLSKFLAVPMDEITVNVSDDGVPISSNFALFSAFCALMMMLARNEAIDRKISVALDFLGGAVTVKASFRTENELTVTNETFLWDYIATDKRMLFEYYYENDRFCVSFQPLFIDWSYLGIKQERNADMVFDNEV